MHQAMRLEHVLSLERFKIGFDVLECLGQYSASITIRILSCLG